MLLNWYSYSITGFWDCLGDLFTRSFHLAEKIQGGINIFYIVLLSVLFVSWMVIMNNYYKDHKDKGLIQ
jgi:hypothetical protein